MPIVPLTQKRFALVDERDLDWASQTRWCFQAGNSKSIRGYARNAQGFMHLQLMERWGRPRPNLGTFNTLEEAKEARIQAERDLGIFDWIELEERRAALEVELNQLCVSGQLIDKGSDLPLEARYELL